MLKMNSLDELHTLREQVKHKIELREKGDQLEQMIVVRVGLGTCGIGAGAREIINYLSEQVSTRGLHQIIITQGECMGYCDAEPTLEVIKPGQERIVYGHVTQESAKEILERYILGGEQIEHIVPITYQLLHE